MLPGAVAHPTNIILVGPMGSGKTAVGRAIARLLNREFHDTDRFIEEKTGVDVSFIFEKEGEIGFRRREAEAIRHFSSLSSIVLATGGGAILEHANRSSLSASGYVIYLKASAESLFERTRQSKNRPLLEAGDLKASIEKILGERNSLYEAVADATVTTDGRRVRQVAGEILHILQKEGIAGADA